MADLSSLNLMTNSRSLLHSVFAILLVAGCLRASFAVAQASLGSVTGTVTDPSGALVPSATVALSGIGGFSKSVASGANGVYSFGQLQPGQYSLSVTASGFAAFT